MCIDIVDYITAVFWFYFTVFVVFSMYRATGTLVSLLNWLSTTPLRRAGEWGHSSTFVELGTRWWMISFTSRPFYPRGKSRRYPLDRRRGGAQSRSELCGEQKNLMTLPEIEPRSSSPWSVAILTGLSRLLERTEEHYIWKCWLQILGLHINDWLTRVPAAFCISLLGIAVRPVES
jgi:hypothetical protein